MPARSCSAPTCKWQWWHSRLHLAYFALLAPVAAITLVDAAFRLAVPFVMLVLTTSAAITIATNESRPILSGAFLAMPREQQYMAPDNPHMIEGLSQAAGAIAASGCRHVGLKLNFDDPEYPLWIMLRDRGFQGSIRHVYVQNNSFRLQPSNSHAPCLILAAQGKPPSAVLEKYPHSRTYGRFSLLWNRDCTHRPSTQRAATF